MNSDSDIMVRWHGRMGRKENKKGKDQNTLVGMCIKYFFKDIEGTRNICCLCRGKGGSWGGMGATETVN